MDWIYGWQAHSRSWPVKSKTWPLASTTTTQLHRVMVTLQAQRHVWCDDPAGEETTFEVPLEVLQPASAR